MVYQVEITPTALEALGAIADRRTRNAIVRRIDALAEEPQKVGKPLGGWLAVFMSIRAVGQRYRVVSRVEAKKRLVLVYLVGIRREGDKRDIYALARRLVQRGLI